GPYRRIPNQNSFLLWSGIFRPSKRNKWINYFPDWPGWSFSCTICLLTCWLIVSGGPGKFIARTVLTISSPHFFINNTTEAKIFAAASFRRHIDPYLAAIIIKL